MVWSDGGWGERSGYGMLWENGPRRIGVGFCIGTGPIIGAPPTDPPPTEALMARSERADRRESKAYIV